MKIIECPRDAMQGLEQYIPVATKADYINSLLKIGFDTIDFGSFVSPKAIPQLRDTAEVLGKLNLNNSQTKLLAIVANERGANDACNFEEISYLGFPFSISETFQKRNINSTISESFKRLSAVREICHKNNKKLVTYFSMAFGNPYGDEWSTYIVAHWAEKLLKELEIKILSLSDTIGTSNRENIRFLFEKLIPEFPQVEFGAHLHTTPAEWEEKIDAAFRAGCRRFDTAIKGYGGCPMAKDKLTGNMPTENLLSYLKGHQLTGNIDLAKFDYVMKNTSSVFPKK
ncbi:MAG: hydroxymethylglutaryl-CoA lyase [Crocinitomicaceae bacterium]|jgi:hydroxymethylglutaryl-CoA lyase|nr:hydroxymethylglutaryl-CoA lyase [Crocinitomicaceae bacterium]MBT6513249.1 hydroxymethylglutaryl-CoA lyase [Crocinitomicaceae bacterium]